MQQLMGHQTCWVVLIAKNWCWPSAPHTYPNARLSVTSRAIKEILLTVCSCSITCRKNKKINLKNPQQQEQSQKQLWILGTTQWQNSIVLLTPVFSSVILIPSREMFTQILCLCLPWERAATAMPYTHRTPQTVSETNATEILHTTITQIHLINWKVKEVHMYYADMESKVAGFGMPSLNSRSVNYRARILGQPFWTCTFSFIMESWLILSPLASGTSSMPISLALYLTPSPWNLASRYSSVFSGAEERKINGKIFNNA